MSPAEIAGLLSAAFAAGAMNAIAGGGTLLTFPTLLFFGTSPIVANATSTLALVIGTAGGVFGYREHLQSIREWLWRFLPVSLIGGLIGSYLLTRTTDKAFSRLVPFLILFATILFLAQGAFRRLARAEQEASGPVRSRIAVALLFQLLVAIYGGYFGAGIGILMLASLGFIGFQHIHQMNALKTILSAVINLVAGLLFIFAGLVDWPRALIMTAGALAGYFASQARVRHVITAIGLTLSVVTFYREFLR